VPEGRKAEDDAIAACYLLEETSSAQYLQRTEWNARDADGTAIFTVRAELTGGSKRTAEFAQKHRKPWIHLSQSLGTAQAASQLRQFVSEHGVCVLNVAGSRPSKESQVGAFVQAVLNAALAATSCLPADCQ
jgi:Circularly permutated YpsA SLOG family